MQVQAQNPAGATANRRNRIEQIYVTHCHKSDSVLDEVGFSVRASSTSEPALLRFARDSYALSLPIDMWSGQWQPEQKPRRLALLPAPGGRVALLHSCALDTDTKGRPRNFFTHALILDRLSPREALMSWGSRSWITEYAPGEPKELSECKALPQGDQVGDAALVRFLADQPAPTAQALAVMTNPGRLAGSPDRGRFLEAALHTWLLLARQPAGAAGVGPNARSKLFIQAEPGLVALLLYGVTRLLPDEWVEGLTFSTYEAFNDLRETGSLRAVGTYSNNFKRGLDGEFLTRRGYGIDSFLPAFSPELLASATAPMGGLVEPATAGDWDRVNRLRSWLARSPQPRADLIAHAVSLDQAVQRLNDGKHTLDDLRLIQNSELGRGILEKKEVRQKFLKFLRDHRGNIAILKPFIDLFRHPENLESFRTDARTHLLNGNLKEWRAEVEALGWHLTGPGEASHAVEALLEELMRQGDVPRLTIAARRSILAERKGLKPDWPAVPDQFAWLLDAPTAQDHAELIAMGLPAAWTAQAFARTARSADPSAATAALTSADSAQVRSIVRSMMAAKDGASLVARLVVAGQGRAPEVFGGLLDAGYDPPPKVLDSLLLEAGADQADWDAFWARPDRLTGVLGRLDHTHASAQRVWTKLSGSLNSHCLDPISGQADLLAHLRTVRAQLGTRVPQEPARRIEQWARISDQLHNPPSQANAQKLHDDCCELKLPVDKLLKFAFHTLLAEASDPTLAEKRLHSVIRSVRGFYHNDEKAADVWLGLTKDMPDSSAKARYQIAFFDRAIPQHLWPGLAEKNRGRLEPAALKFLTVATAATPIERPAAYIPAARLTGAARPVESPTHTKGRKKTSIVLNSSFKVALGVCAALLVTNSYFAWWMQEYRSRARGLQQARKDLDLSRKSLKKAESDLQDANNKLESKESELAASIELVKTREAERDNSRKGVGGLNQKIKALELALAAAKPAGPAPAPPTPAPPSQPPVGAGSPAAMTATRPREPREIALDTPGLLGMVYGFNREHKPGVYWISTSEAHFIEVLPRDGSGKSSSDPHSLFPPGSTILAAAPDGKTIAVGAGHAVKLFRPSSESSLSTDQPLGQGEANLIAVSPTGYLAAVAVNATATTPDQELCKPRWPEANSFFVTYPWDEKRGNQRVVGLAVDDKSRTFVVGLADGFVELWDSSNLTAPMRVPLGRSIEGIQFNQDARSVVIFGLGFVVYWDLAQLRKTLAQRPRKENEIPGFYTLKRIPPNARVTAAAFSPDGSQLLIGYDDGVIELRPNNPNNIRESYKQPHRVTGLGFSSDARWFASSSTSNVYIRHLPRD